MLFKLTVPFLTVVEGRHLSQEVTVIELATRWSPNDLQADS